MTNPPESLTFTVEPARLEHGTWCHEAEKTLGRGDIANSYSADRIGMGKPVAMPFLWQGALWICTGSSSRGGKNKAEAYRVVHPSQFPRTATTYGDKLRVDGGDMARADPYGFYDGMAVQCGRERLILCGPEATFMAGETQQLDLFGG